MIIDKARELGIALSETEEFKNMNEAQRAMELDSEIMAKLDEFNSKQSRIMEVMSGEESDPDEMSALSTQMEAIRGQLLAEEKFVKMLEAQAAFEALMKRVNRAIGVCIGAEMTEDDDGTHSCGGDCSGCSGCH